MPTERDYKTLTDKEYQTRFCAIFHWSGTDLTDSTYVMDCDTPEQAAHKALAFFSEKRSGLLFQAIAKIDILPQGRGRYDNCVPVLSYVPTN